MSIKRFKRQKLKKQLFTKNRLVILNDDTFEEVFSFKLTLMNVFVVATLGAILIIFFTTFIIAFTPLREYIPGYSSTELKEQALELALKTDSLKKDAAINEAYIASIKKIMTGKLEYAKLNKDSILNTDIQVIDESKIKPTEEEIKLRKNVEKEDKFNLFDKAQSKVKLVLFPPAKGPITEKFNSKIKHYAVDIALAKNTPIKATANGTIIFSNWTPDDGNVIIVKHNDGLLSLYKHAATVTKEQGDVVRTGEVIAIAGSTGKNSTGVHLHFELWKDGYPIDPTQFIDFE